jgi:hypothetical protein
VHLGLKAKVNSLNKAINARNAARSVVVAPEVPVELRYGRALKGHVRSILYNANMSGQCSGYVVRLAENLFGKKYVNADAWDLPKANKVVSQRPFDHKNFSGGFSKHYFSRDDFGGLLLPESK